ncbi:MAG: carbohydrate ABC transporter permease [Lachnospiraceae bacterium]|jgi:N-acetylglucosamine transport system permease protein|nr:carbohydrate ABC transporter permease [Lachnospiraceae bacterium]MCH4032337.1 carbohydrate ABC transporter permease [Lachnospiraceae bacterium]MCH4108785.1 carbohydrate ABC transporter permease [Lachnospiraceae bacterium]MCI1302316.1 carbohydrate ABC transporter permease [Lachnospiraceae bacterium]MCI1331482.1 carbohydrate ABC transporter permease [Lachnospiraceae bacterium]
MQRRSNKVSVKTDSTYEESYGHYSFARELRKVPPYLLLIMWVAFTAIVILWVVAASLSTTSDIFKGQVFDFANGLHFENYARAWSSSHVSVYFANSALYTVISCSLLILICAPYAYVLARFHFPGAKLLNTLLAATTGVPVVMIVIPLYMFFARAGLLRQPLTNRIVLIVLYVATKIPYTTIFLEAYFENISRTYEEAAAIDGCHPIPAFWRIVFPMAQGGLITVTLFNFISIWNEYFLSLMIVNNESLRPVAVGLFSMINGMQYSGDWAGLFASVIIVFLPTFILYLILSKYIIGGMTGGIKG